MDSRCGESCTRSTDLTQQREKLELLERVMEDHPPQGRDVNVWFMRGLDLIGECEQARGRLIDDDIKVEVVPKRNS